ncbi:MAG: hypothetical protein D6712_10545 [Chloroflexi bacterium]|nr:MAG: hypothetical protein D6712_10545 [Chloroflexota bacterium]
MKRYFVLLLLFVLAGGVFAQDAGLQETLSQGSQAITVGEQLLAVQFAEGEWETYRDDLTSLAPDAAINAYIATTNNTGLIWGVRENDIFDDVIIMADVVVTGPEDNGFGVSCRSNPANNGDGYYFEIGMDNTYRILAIENGEFFTLTGEGNWADMDVELTPIIPTTVMGVCSGDYLALYVNGQLIDEVKDDRFTEGLVGLMIQNFHEDTGYSAMFTNVEVWSTSTSGATGGKGDGGKGDGGINIGGLGGSKDDYTQAVQAILDDAGIELGNVLVDDDFSEEEGALENFTGENSHITRSDGLLLVDVRGYLFTFTQTEEAFADVVVAVDATTLAGEQAQSVGVTCRADSEFNGYGYYFEVEPNGNFWMGYVNEEGAFNLLLPDQTSSATINQGANATNQIVAVCVGDYLALYVNGELMVEANDTTFTEPGHVGVLVRNFNQETATTAFASFDNFRVWSATRR